MWVVFLCLSLALSSFYSPKYFLNHSSCYHAYPRDCFTWRSIPCSWHTKRGNSPSLALIKNILPHFARRWKQWVNKVDKRYWQHLISILQPGGKSNHTTLKNEMNYLDNSQIPGNLTLCRISCIFSKINCLSIRRSKCLLSVYFTILKICLKQENEVPIPYYPDKTT